MMRHFQFHYGIATLAYVFLAMILICGCSSATSGGSTVTGMVSLSGTPIKSGMIKVQQEEGHLEFSEIKDGAYRFGSLPIGSYKVTIIGGEAPSPPNNKHSGVALTAPNRLRQQRYTEIPDRYGDIYSTPLTLEVTTGPQTKDFNLEP